MPWGVAAAVIGAAGAVYSSDKQAATAKKNRQSSRPEAYLEDADQDALSRARDIAGRQYTAYDGDRVAGLSENERSAISLAGDNSARSYLDKAGNTIDGVVNWNSDTAKKYMNPYIDNVVNHDLDNENRAFTQRQYQNQSRSAAVGALGSDRSALINAAETGQHLRSVSDITDRGYSDAFKNAVNTWTADNETKLRSAQAYEAVGGDIQKMKGDQITQLLRTGQADRLMRQMDLDVDYSDWLEKRDWDVNNLQPLLKAVAGSRGGQVIDQTSSGPKSDRTSELLGLASTLVGYYGQYQGGSGSGGGTSTPNSLEGNTNYWNDWGKSLDLPSSTSK